MPKRTRGGGGRRSPRSRRSAAAGLQLALVELHALAHHGRPRPSAWTLEAPAAVADLQRKRVVAPDDADRSRARRSRAGARCAVASWMIRNAAWSTLAGMPARRALDEQRHRHPTGAGAATSVATAMQAALGLVVASPRSRPRRRSSSPSASSAVATIRGCSAFGASRAIVCSERTISVVELQRDLRLLLGSAELRGALGELGLRSWSCCSVSRRPARVIRTRLRPAGVAGARPGPASWCSCPLCRRA